MDEEYLWLESLRGVVPGKHPVLVHRSEVITLSSLKKKRKRKHLTLTALQGWLLLKGQFTKVIGLKWFFSCLCEREWDRQKFKAVSGGGVSSRPLHWSVQNDFPSITNRGSRCNLTSGSEQPADLWLVFLFRIVVCNHLSALLMFYFGGGTACLVVFCSLRTCQIDPYDDSSHFRKEEH